MRFDVILALTDLSTHENMAVQRACLLAAGHGARVRLMHVPSRRPTVAGAASRLALLAHRFEHALHVPVDCAAPDGATLADVAQAARQADLVVACERHGRGLGDLLAGGPTARLLRTVPRPVLVVRSAPLANYLRVLTGVDLGSASEALVRFARAIQPYATLELFHAISTVGEARLRLAGASERAIRLYRRQCLERTEARLGLLRVGVHSSDSRVEIGLGGGDTARALLARQQRAAADLIILGRRQRTAWSEFFARSTTRNVLAWGRCDLLSVLEDAEASLVSAAPQDAGAQSGHTVPSRAPAG